MGISKKKTVATANDLPKTGAHGESKIGRNLSGTAVFPWFRQRFKRFSFNLLDGTANVWQTLAHAVGDVDRE